MILVPSARSDPPRIHLHSLIARAGTAHWFNGITPGFYDSHLAVIAYKYPNGVGGAWSGASYPSPSISNSRIYATGLPSAAASTTPSPAPPSAATSPPSPPAWAPSFYTDHGGVSGQPCTPARSPLHVLEIHGGSNTDVPYAGVAGEGGTEPAIPDWLSWWAARNGSTAASTTETPFDRDALRRGRASLELGVRGGRERAATLKSGRYA
ncbi:hypothetical protein B0H14DRAFT_3444750 [Mycena olivaceomarginata]|nr:hypothetical protein B0H14DRAFT_3444750 [Mycena olivaceomarginata]